MKPSHSPLARSTQALLAGACLFGTLLPAGPSRAADKPDKPDDPLIQTAFEKGTLAEGQRSLERALAGSANPGDAARERYALGIMQFLRSAETMGQGWHRFGLRADGLAASLPFLRLPAGSADPASAAPISYEDFRAVFVRFLADVQTAERTFAALPDDPGAVELRPGLVRVDYVGDGLPASTETVWRTYGRLNRGMHLSEEDTAEKDAAGFLIRFDAGDVPWFRGYCHVLSALAETLLAYDETQLFDHTAHLFFARPKTPFPFLVQPKKSNGEMFDFSNIADLVAFVHLMNFPLREPARLAAARDHLAAVPALSRESWRRIEAETDDDHEWLPNPRQTGAVPGLQVTQEKIDAWLKLLDETDALLAGKKLLPFWRGQLGGRRGVNLRRVFTEPTPFDLMLWVQGTSATPYLEEGALTDPQWWSRVSTAFRGNTLGFALYFN